MNAWTLCAILALHKGQVLVSRIMSSLHVVHRHKWRQGSNMTHLVSDKHTTHNNVSPSLLLLHGVDEQTMFTAVGSLFGTLPARTVLSLPDTCCNKFATGPRSGKISRSAHAKINIRKVYLKKLIMIVATQLAVVRTMLQTVSMTASTIQCRITKHTTGTSRRANNRRIGRNHVESPVGRPRTKAEEYRSRTWLHWSMSELEQFVSSSWDW